MILGTQGSRVKLSFERRESTGEIHQFECTLVRGTAEYLNSIGAPRGMDDDVDEARMQLRQALAHCAQDREELDRLRKMLQQERETAQRREREIEQLQASNAEEIAKLNETLRRAEQVSVAVACITVYFGACMPAALNIAQVLGAEIIHNFNDHVNGFSQKLR